jgi:predicted NUDIX family NTP pyrophosphohydrolase
MAKKSAGMLIYRMTNGILEVFLVHPGGPFWAKKDLGAWSIPKGEYEDGENPLDAAKREVKEETGINVDGKFEALSPVKQKSGKIVTAWAIEANIDPSTIKSNTFEMEWPPRSGKMKEFPEVDRAAWFTTGEALNKIVEGQIPLLKELESRLNG